MAIQQEDRPAEGASATGLEASIHCEFELPVSKAVIRPLQETDLKQLEWHGGADLRAFYLAEWSAHCGGQLYVLVVEYNRFAIGQIAVHWTGNGRLPGPHLESLRVFQAFQRLGLGTRLLRACEDVARRSGYQNISISVGSDNPSARRLYQREGYEIVGEPYMDVWHYTNASGQSIRVEELVSDMLKKL